jgi:hypothetical protein
MLKRGLIGQAAIMPWHSHRSLAAPNTSSLRHSCGEISILYKYLLSSSRSFSFCSYQKLCTYHYQGFAFDLINSITPFPNKQAAPLNTTIPVEAA